MRPVLILCRVTFQEALRRRILLAALLLALGFLALFALGLHLQTAHWTHRGGPPPLVRAAVLNAQTMLGLYGADLLTAALAVLAAIDTLSGEVSSGTIQAIATKPIERWQIVLGKWMGLAAIVTGFFLLTGLGILAAAQGLAAYRVAGAARGFSLIWLEAMLLLSTTLLGGTLFSTLANGVVNLGLFLMAFLGGWMEQIGAVSHNSAIVLTGIGISLIMPSEALWRRAAFEMASPLSQAFPFSPFGRGSTPSTMMVDYAAGYLLAALALALWRFQRRDL